MGGPGVPAPVFKGDHAAKTGAPLPTTRRGGPYIRPRPISRFANPIGLIFIFFTKGEQTWRLASFGPNMRFNFTDFREIRNMALMLT